MESYKQSIISMIDDHRDEYVKISKKIWQLAEVALEENESSEIFVDLLESEGFKVEKGVGGIPTAFVAEYGKGFPVIGMNVEYDALPGLSQKAGLTEKEAVVTDAPGHGCGHNLLGTAAAAAGITLKKWIEEHKKSGTIKLFGSPAEEICLGKPFVARDGHYKAVDCFLDWHPWSYNRADPDFCNAYFSVKYHFSGTKAHGNAPWHGRSTLDAAMLTGQAIEFLREHIEPSEPETANTINYTFSEVGPAIANVVPDKSTLWVIGRFKEVEKMMNALKRVDKCAEAGALATETKVVRETLTVTHDKIPNASLAKVVYDNFMAIGAPPFDEADQKMAKAMQKYDGIEETGLDTVIKPFGPSATALCDTSEFTWFAPYASFWMTSAPPEGWHNWRVAACAGSDIGMKTMIHAAKLLAISGAELLMNPEKVENAKVEWQERMGNATFDGVLPDDVQPALGIYSEVTARFKDRLKAAFK